MSDAWSFLFTAAAIGGVLLIVLLGVVAIGFASSLVGLVELLALIVETILMPRQKPHELPKLPKPDQTDDKT
ncbi:MAG: hypothetical protein GY913_17660 [Proteobacteria bacterium]|nr:hypothetical protein [Pseudomonadota bacterium]MCP4918733.1 hypothetical protein [Pseudomonadota bacterium]